MIQSGRTDLSQPNNVGPNHKQHFSNRWRSTEKTRVPKISGEIKKIFLKPLAWHNNKD